MLIISTLIHLPTTAPLMVQQMIKTGLQLLPFWNLHDGGARHSRPSISGFTLLRFDICIWQETPCKIVRLQIDGDSGASRHTPQPNESGSGRVEWLNIFPIPNLNFHIHKDKF